MSRFVRTARCWRHNAGAMPERLESHPVGILTGYAVNSTARGSEICRFFQRVRRMTHVIKSVALVLLATLLSACATLSPEQVAQECAATDWQTYGVGDGKLGLPTNARSERFSECQTVGQPVDLVAYQAGRTEGLLDYCTAERGYQIGYSGRRYQNVCPPTSEPDFLQGFARGRNDRPAVAVYPSFGIGLGSYGGYGGISIGIGSFGWGPCWWYNCGYRYKRKRKRHRYKHHHKHRHKHRQRNRHHNKHRQMRHGYGR